MNKMEQQNELPDLPSELIMLALVDLQKCKESPDYEIHMCGWHVPQPDTKICHVCLAGSIMAQTLGRNKDYDRNMPSYNINPSLFKKKLTQLANDFREAGL